MLLLHRRQRNLLLTSVAAVFWATLILGNVDANAVQNLIFENQTQVEGKKCPYPYFVPPNFDLTNTAQQFPFLESGLQVYFDLRVPCNGVVTQWNFLAATETVRGLHLGVFRPSNDKTKLLLVGETYLNDWNTGGFENSWVSYKTGDKAVQVQTGDVFGVFYDPNVILGQNLAIRSSSKFFYRSAQARGTTLVYQGISSIHILQSSCKLFGIVCLSDMQFVYFLDQLTIGDGTLVNRDPALFAVVAPEKGKGKSNV